MKRRIARILPWVITAIALFLAFRSVEWDSLLRHFRAANLQLLAAAVGCTCLSYLFRARRWLFLFPERVPVYLDSLRVLILGFFMNNILPARTGELVRAHLGSKITGSTRTLVLATIASERLVDGLTISLMFVVFALGLGGEEYSQELLWVAYLFAAVALGVAVTLSFRGFLFRITKRLKERHHSRAAQYTLGRVEIFIDGLAPLFYKSRAPVIVLWSLVVWGIELIVFMAVGCAYGVDLGVHLGVLFLVAVNFSSLIPAGPGGIGVVEFVATAVLVSVGLDREVALAMVLSQHMIQYLVIGVSGAWSMLRWKGQVLEAEAEISSA